MLNEIKEAIDSDEREQKPKYTPGNEADFERLYQTSYGKILGTHQRKMRLREVGEVIRRIGRPELAPDPQEHIEHRDLAEALAKLPPKQAAAIVLRHYHGYTNRAIAQSLGIPERTVASRLAVAKDRLRVMLRHSYGDASNFISEPGLVAAAD